MRRQRPTLLRLLEKFKIADSGCWEWVGVRHKFGYGQLWDGRRLGCAHRIAYELFVGPIPAGLQIDHLCRNRCCINPAHLEAVTPMENFKRGFSPTAIVCRTGICVKGHPLDDRNTYTNPNTGKRYCRTCKRNRPRWIGPGQYINRVRRDCI